MEPIENLGSFISIPYEITDKILPLLDFRSLLNFESAGKDFPTLTAYAWKQRKIIDLLNFSWKISEAEFCINKWDYCLSCLLHQYIIVDKFSTFLNSSGLEKVKSEKYVGIAEKFPFLNQFIGIDSALLPSISFCEDLIDVSQEHTGELLFQGLILSKQESPEISKIEQYFHQAIKKQATYVSLLALEINPSSSSKEIKIMRWLLAVEAAKQGDQRCLSILIKTLGIEELFAAASHKLNAKQYLDADVIYTEALCHAESISIPILLKMAYVKLKIHKIKLADEFYTLAIITCDYSLPGWALSQAGSVKYMLADFCIDFAIAYHPHHCS